MTRALTDLASRPGITPPIALASVGAAVLFGVVHALAPGHGKTVMAAYLVGQRGSRREAWPLGAVVTLTHTASVLALAAVLAVGALAVPELVLPVTQVLSGVLLALVGTYLGVLAVRRLRAVPDERGPSPHHEHGHHHDHRLGDQHHERRPGADDADLRATAGGLAVAVHPVAHSHGGRAHVHEALPSGPLSWKALVGMGVAGGLVPSPSALLVLLAAAALGRAAFGVLLVIAYGVGMALTLTAAGWDWTGGRAAVAARPLPLGTAAVVVLVGALLVGRGVLTGHGLL